MVQCIDNELDGNGRDGTCYDMFFIFAILHARCALVMKMTLGTWYIQFIQVYARLIFSWSFLIDFISHKSIEKDMKQVRNIGATSIWIFIYKIQLIRCLYCCVSYC